MTTFSIPILIISQFDYVLLDCYHPICFETFVKSFGRSYIRIKLESDELNKSFQKDSIMPSPIGNDKDIAKTQVSDFLAITLSEIDLFIFIFR